MFEVWFRGVKFAGSGRRLSLRFNIGLFRDSQEVALAARYDQSGLPSYLPVTLYLGPYRGAALTPTTV
jgi:hypothetical protein